jgi:KDO2-lipid IV(A) lauroyltransferase
MHVRSPWPRWLSRRRLSTLHALGAVLGWLVWLLSPPYRRRLRENADRAGIGAAARRASVAEAGRMTLEIPRAVAAPGRRAAAPTRRAGRVRRSSRAPSPAARACSSSHRTWAASRWRRRPTRSDFGRQQPMTRAVPPGAPGRAARTRADPRAHAPALDSAPATLGRRAPAAAGAAPRRDRGACCPTRCLPKGRACGCPSSATPPTR